MIEARILIDGRELAKRRGIGHFTRELLYNLDKSPRGGVRVICLTTAEGASALGYTLKNVDLVVRKGADAITWEQLILPFEVARRDVTHVLCPYNTFPLFISSKIKRIIVYHDLIFIHHWKIQSSVKLKIGNLYRSALVKFLRPEDRLLTVSGFSRDVIRRFLKRDAAVIGNDVQHLRAVFEMPSSRLIENDYLLHVGGDASTKNTVAVLKAFQAARFVNGPIPDLVVMGISRSFKGSHEGKENPRVHFLCDISEEDKCSLYRHCLAVVFPSLKEGFGLPIIEAHAFGKRVLTSRIRPMSELAAPHDILINPKNLQEMTSAISDIVTDNPQSGVPNVAVRLNQAEIVYSAL